MVNITPKTHNMDVSQEELFCIKRAIYCFLLAEFDKFQELELTHSYEWFRDEHAVALELHSEVVDSIAGFACDKHAELLRKLLGLFSDWEKTRAMEEKNEKTV